MIRCFFMLHTTDLTLNDHSGFYINGMAYGLRVFSRSLSPKCQSIFSGTASVYWMNSLTAHVLISSCIFFLCSFQLFNSKLFVHFLILIVKKGRLCRMMTPPSFANLSFVCSWFVPGLRFCIAINFSAPWKRPDRGSWNGHFYAPLTLIWKAPNLPWRKVYAFYCAHRSEHE